jgi:glycerol-3-phosphate cytidylyltransferase
MDKNTETENKQKGKTSELITREKKIVYTGGTFDLPHAGHVNFLRKCSKIGDEVIVSLNTDEFIEKYKGNPPVMRYHERKAVLEAYRYVTKVIKNVGGSDSKVAIEQVKPHFIVIGSDWAARDYYKQMQFTQEWLDERDITLCYVPYTLGVSTTEVKRRLKVRYDQDKQRSEELKQRALAFQKETVG